MINFFKKLFKEEPEEAIAVRSILSPDDLRKGDIVKFKFCKQGEVSGKTFLVDRVNTYLYNDVCYPELVLKGDDDSIIYMMYEDEDGEEYVALSLKLNKADNNLIFDASLDEVISADLGFEVSTKENAHLPGKWVKPKYNKVDKHISGAFIKGDARYLSDQKLSQQEKFISELFEDRKGNYAIEIEKYGSGEIEVSITVYLDLSEIDEMWPSNT